MFIECNMDCIYAVVENASWSEQGSACSESIGIGLTLGSETIVEII